MKEEVLLKVEELVQTLKEEEDYQKFLLLENKLKDDVKFSELMIKLKEIQRELVHNEYKGINVDKKQQEYQNLLNDMNFNPIYIEYLNSIDELDLKYQLIIKQIEKSIKEI